MKRIPSVSPDYQITKAKLVIPPIWLFAAFIAGCALILSVAGCLEFRRMALKAQAQADDNDVQISILQVKVDLLKSWDDEFEIRLTNIQKYVNEEMVIAPPLPLEDKAASSN